MKIKLVVICDMKDNVVPSSDLFIDGTIETLMSVNDKYYKVSSFETIKSSQYSDQLANNNTEKNYPAILKTKNLISNMGYYPTDLTIGIGRLSEDDLYTLLELMEKLNSNLVNPVES